MALAQAERKLYLQASFPSGLSGRAGRGEPSVEWTPTLHFRGPGPLCPSAVRSRALHVLPQSTPPELLGKCLWGQSPLGAPAAGAWAGLGLVGHGDRLRPAWA